MDELTKIVAEINSVLWGSYCLILLLVGAGIYFIIRPSFVQIRRFGRAVKYSFADFRSYARSTG